MKKEVIVHRDPKSPTSEVFRTLRTNIQFMSSNKGLKTLLITSTLPEEGKSWVSSNLAVTFAQAGKRVVLIDADMRKGRQYNIFGVESNPGLSNYLSGFDETKQEETISISRYIKETEVENLYVIPTGNVPPNPSELLVSSKMSEMLDTLKQICDIIILDGPPSLLVTDSILLSRYVDSTLIVTKYKTTKIDNLEKVKKDIQNVGGKIAGVVINKIPISANKYESSYYYGSSSSRGDKIVTKKSDKEKLEVSNRLEEEDISKNKINNQDKEVKIDIEGNVPEEKTEQILQEINKYLKEEKNKIDDKGE